MLSSHLFRTSGLWTYLPGPHRISPPPFCGACIYIQLSATASIHPYYQLPSTAILYMPSIGSVPSLLGHAIAYCIPIPSVHCLDSSGTGPVVLEVIPVTGATFSGIIHGPISVCTSLLPYPSLVLQKWKKCAIQKESIGGSSRYCTAHMNTVEHTAMVQQNIHGSSGGSVDIISKVRRRYRRQLVLLHSSHAYCRAHSNVSTQHRLIERRLRRYQVIYYTSEK